MAVSSGQADYIRISTIALSALVVVGSIIGTIVVNVASNVITPGVTRASLHGVKTLRQFRLRRIAARILQLNERAKHPHAYIASMIVSAVYCAIFIAALAMNLVLFDRHDYQPAGYILLPVLSQLGLLYYISRMYWDFHLVAHHPNIVARLERRRTKLQDRSEPDRK